MIASSNTYEEIYQILFCMDKYTVMKIPENILKDIISKRNKQYITRIDIRDIFNKDNMSEEAFNYLCWLDFEFWMTDEKKKELGKECRIKQIREEEQKRKKYNPDDIFSKKKKDVNIEENQNSSIEENMAMIEVKKQNIIVRTIEKIKILLRKR